MTKQMLSSDSGLEDRPTMVSEQPTRSAEKSSVRIDALQLLRAAAAGMVVIGHMIGAARSRPDLFGPIGPIHYAGGAGVDVFFLISGFIMVRSSASLFEQPGAPGEFLRRRLVRILPLYWLATALAVATAWTKSGKGPDLQALTASFLFFPFDTSGRGDGMAYPIFDLGWTLNYEMLFYLVFALFLRWPRGRCVAAVSTLMAVTVVLGAWFDPAILPLRFWSQPIELEFVAGMGVALAFAPGKAALPWWVRAALTASAIAYYLADPFGLFLIATTPNDEVRLVQWGLPAALLLVAAVSGPVPLLRSHFGRGAVVLGDASYALYLAHPFAITAMLKLVAYSGVGRHLGIAGFLITGSILAAIASIFIHKSIEVPLTGILNGLTRRSGPAVAVARSRG